MHSITSKITSFFHTLLSKKSKAAYVRDVVGDWRKRLVLFVCLAIVVIVLCAYFFLKLSRGEFFTAGIKKPETTELLNTKILADTNMYYTAKQEKIEALTSTSSVPIDPSL
jgi:Na+-transporting NADH:ubiquinone oxidoreductase subunit NqrB